jgi:hypothetical protein
MELEDMRCYIRVAGAYGCSHLCLTGGEPFLVKEDLLEAIGFAKELGFFIDARTNGFWAGRYAETLFTLTSFKKKGLDRLGLSFDKYHKKVPRDFVMNVLKACKELKIDAYIDCVDSKAKKENVASHLGVDQSTIRSCVPPQRLGRAQRLDPGEFKKVKWTDFRNTCGKGENYGLSLYVTPSGETSLHECCWGNPALFLGNIRLTQNRMHFLFRCFEKRNSHPIYNFLKKNGPKGLVKLALDVNPECVRSYYSGECEACFSLLANPIIIDAIEKQDQERARFSCSR